VYYKYVADLTIIGANKIAAINLRALVGNCLNSTKQVGAFHEHTAKSSPLHLIIIFISSFIKFIFTEYMLYE